MFQVQNRKRMAGTKGTKKTGGDFFVLCLLGTMKTGTVRPTEKRKSVVGGKRMRGHRKRGCGVSLSLLSLSLSLSLLSLSLFEPGAAATSTGCEFSHHCSSWCMSSHLPCDTSTPPLPISKFIISFVYKKRSQTAYKTKKESSSLLEPPKLLDLLEPPTGI
jgi:hypothetical protein